VNTLIDLFTLSADANADRVAISDESGSMLTYRELDGLSTRVAHELRARGVGREDRVGIHLRRRVDLFVAVLAVLKAGGAYVVVDHRYPEARRTLMLETAAVRLTLTESDWCGQGPNPAVWEEIRDSAAVDAALAAAPGPTDAACVLFTSGSTGAPKGVVLEHGSVAAFAVNPSLPKLEPTDKVAQVANVSFDAVHFELWGALAAGAELAVMPSLADLVHTDLRRELRRRRITAMLAPTMAVNHITGEDADAFSGLRVLHTGGDVVRPAACRAILDAGFDGVMCNLYGPTEATTAVTCYDVSALPTDAVNVPIGGAIDGTWVLLLDDQMRPVPVGMPGDLYIGGIGVARGYLRDPARTAERFMPDPSGPSGSTMYATGDRARDLGDGVLEYLGRSDDQVKVRGYRVEPPEVEKALLAHEQVRDVAVIVVGEGQDCRLVAFVVPEDEELAPQALRAYADSTMPDYQVPSELLLVETIPANSHGKRDRDRLLALLGERERSREEYVAPRTDSERYLTRLWETLLGIERISVTDDFLRLGGHSMLAFRVRRRIERDFAVKLPVQAVLENTVLADLAVLMDGQVLAR
jgi:amino acid adenylation domain-containing protein